MNLIVVAFVENIVTSLVDEIVNEISPALDCNFNAFVNSSVPNLTVSDLAEPDAEITDDVYLSSLDKSILDGVNIVNISSGASTPDEVVNEIIEYLKSI